MRLAHEAERDADNSALISLIDEVLSQPDITQYPEFQATVRLERAYAFSTDTIGLNNEQARFVQSELAWIRAHLGSSLNAQLTQLLQSVDGLTCLVVGTESTDIAALLRARQLLGDACTAASPAFSAPLCNLLYLRAEAFLLIARRAIAQSPPIEVTDLPEVLAAFVRRQNAENYTASRRLAFSYHVAAATGSYELWRFDPAAGRVATIAGLTLLNQSFVMMLGAANQQPSVIGPSPCVAS